jgi:hypothetical protein
VKANRIPAARRCAWTFGVGTLLYCGTAFASVLCTDKDARVWLRSGCLETERPVSAAELDAIAPPGAVGPRGTRGPRGHTGAAGAPGPFRPRDMWDYVTPLAQSGSAVIAASALFVAGLALRTSLNTLRAQERRFEIEMSPWLSGSALKPQEVPDDVDPMRLRRDAYLVVRNVGRTPACAVSIETEWAIESADGRLVQSDREPRREEMTIAPADEHHQRLCRLPFDAPGQVGKIKTMIRYRSAVGGTGEVRLSFVQRPAPRDGWINGPNHYWFQTSSGLQLGERDKLPDWPGIRSFYDDPVEENDRPGV